MKEKHYFTLKISAIVFLWSISISSIEKNSKKSVPCLQDNCKLNLPHQERESKIQSEYIKNMISIQKNLQDLKQTNQKLEMKAQKDWEERVKQKEFQNNRNFIHELSEESVKFGK